MLLIFLRLKIILGNVLIYKKKVKYNNNVILIRNKNHQEKLKEHENDLKIRKCFSKIL